MKFNKKNIKKFKGIRVRVKYTIKDIPHDFTGIILYNLTDYFILKINNENEIPIKYDCVESIEKIKSFASYIKKAEKFFESKEYQKAHDVVFQLKEYEIFKLPEQIEEIDNLINKYKGELFKKAKNNSINGLDKAIKEVEFIDNLKEVVK